MMKVKPVKLGKTERMSFSHIDEVISMPNLIEVQKNSYQWFLDEGLKEVFHDIGTIEDYTGNLALSFVDFRLDKEPKYSIKECKERDVTYAAPLRVTARLLNKETGEAEVHKAQCQIAGVVLNGADVVEDLLQAFVQEPLIRVLLDLDQVRHTDDFVDVGEAHALGFAELDGLDFHHKINHSLLLYSTGCRIHGSNLSRHT